MRQIHAKIWPHDREIALILHDSAEKFCSQRMTIPAEQFHTMQPQLTIFDGQIVFLHPQFAQEYNLNMKGPVAATYRDLEARRARAAGSGEL